MSQDLREQLQATLGDAYLLERELGGGGMSRVFLAHETSLGRKVVVKVLLPELAAGVSVDRFRREIQLAAQLQHPHIVPLLAAGESNGLPYFTMPFVVGESLRARVARGELPVGETVHILRDVVSALAYAHEFGVAHRDIKPDNVLLTGGVAVVTDFGVAKAVSVSSEAQQHTALTSMGMALGTPAYMAPEQATADPNVDHRADIYAYGIMAYEMLTGQTPFHGRSPHAMLGAQLAAIPDPVTFRRPGIPPLLAHLVMKCLEKRPADRPQTASDLMATLDMLTTPSGGTVPLRAVPSGAVETVRVEARGRTGSGAQGASGTETQGRGGAEAAWRRFGVPVGALLVAAGAVFWAVGHKESTVAGPPAPPAAGPAPAPATSPAPRDTGQPVPPAVESTPRATTRPVTSPSLPTNEAALLARMRTQALAARSRAVVAGADSEALAQGDAALAAADSLRAASKTVSAAARLSAATTSWSEAAEAAGRAPARDSAPASTAAPAPEPAPPRPPVATAPPSAPAPLRPSAPAPAPPSDPAPAIRAVFAQYAQAIESRSIPAIRRVYPGLSPAQSKEWEDFFGAVNAIDVDLAVSDLAVSGDSADARLSGVYVFQNPGTRHTQREPVSFQARLRRMGGEWRIEALR